MSRFVEGEDRRQGILLPEYLDDYVSEENPVRVIDVFVEELDLGALGFDGVIPEATGRPGYHPGLLLKIYVYGYINQIASSRRLEREPRGLLAAFAAEPDQPFPVEIEHVPRAQLALQHSQCRAFRPTRRPADIRHVGDVQIDEIAKSPQSGDAPGFRRFASIDLAFGLQRPCAGVSSAPKCLADVAAFAPDDGAPGT